jgi:uncharacterized protein (DUF1697 family)
MPPEFGEDPQSFRYDFWFLLEPARPADVMRYVKTREGVDRVYRGRQVVYTSRLCAQAGKSYLIKIIQEPVYQHITIRGLNTAKKLLELMTQDKAGGIAPQTPADQRPGPAVIPQGR